MTQPTSRATLKDYAKRQLGHPVVELNLDDDQMEDRIDDALEFFQEYHFDGTFPTFLKHQITASTLKITSNVSFEAGETITGGTTGVRATVHEYHSANTTIRYKNPEVKSGGDGNTFYANTTTTFGNSETVTGGTSGASATTAASSANSLGDFDNQYISIEENIIGIKGVIPFFNEDNDLIAIQGRAFGNENPKYITIKIDENQEKIYGTDRVDWDRTVCVVEGPIDSLFIDNCLATAQSDLRVYKDNVVLIPDNEPRNLEIVKQIEKYINENFQVVIWPSDIKQKDINEMILSGKTERNIKDIIAQNTFSGLLARTKLIEWKKV